jgi:hypothetical protein
MATITATAAQKTVSGFFLAPPKYNEKGVTARSVKYSFATAPNTAGSQGDVVLLCPVAKGSLMLGVDLYVSAAAQVTYTINVGDSLSASRYISSATNGAAAAPVFRGNTTGVCYSYSADDVVQATLVAWGSASGAVSLRVTTYVCFDNAGDGNSGEN